MRKIFSQYCVRTAESWISINAMSLRWLQPTKLNIEITANLDPTASYLVVCNHQSWIDIVMLQTALNRKIPFLRFFLKSQLFWVPFLGFAWWALDFPFVKRYSSAYLKKHPNKRGKDIETTRRSCKKFRDTPTSILNFVEGTRFTPEKHDKLKSPFTHLLPAKTGGVATVLDMMGDQFKAVIDVTIVYPYGPHSLADLFFRKVPEVRIRVEEHAVPKAYLEKRSEGDRSAYNEVKVWTNEIWKKKDQTITDLKNPQSPPL